MPTTPQPMGHFNKWSVLEEMLTNYAPPAPEQVSLDTYLGWSPTKRRKFDDARMARIADSVIIETPKVLELVKDLRRAALFANRAVGRTGVFLTGPATVGKTTAAVYAMRDAFRRHADRHPDWKDRGHVPIVYCEIPTECTGKAFMGRILDFFGVPYMPRTTLEERTQMVTNIMISAHTSLLVIDEMQNLDRLRDGDFLSAQAIKGLVNSVNAVPLYVGIDLDKKMLAGSLGNQFAGRATLVQLTRLGNTTDDEKLLWAGVVDAFERQLGLLAHPPRLLLGHADFLWRATQGSLRALSRIFSVTALELIAAGKPEEEVVTPELISSVKLDLATEWQRDKATNGKAPRGKAA